jgi:hypothetical protein
MARVFHDTSSAYGAVTVDVSSADQNIAAGCRGIYVGVTGNVKVDLPNNSAVIFVAAPVGILPVQATKIYNSGTTATSMLALY